MPLGRGLARRLLVLGVALLAAIAAGHAIWHNDRRADVHAAAARSPAAAAGIIARRFGSRRAVCHPVKPRDDIDNLISALMALERFGISPFESMIETVTVHASRWLGLTPPDFSYGPGQIRLSRAVSLTNEAKEPSGGQTRTATASALLEPCAARGVARRLIAQARDLQPNGANTKAVLNRARVIRLAAAYNAQAAPADEKAALAHHLFNRIAYHLTLYYRYESARGRAASRNKK